MTSIDMTTPHHKRHLHTQPATPPIAVQILSTIFFGTFGILAVIFAFNASWMAGLVVALVLGWRGGFVPGGWGNGPATPSMETLMSLAPEADQRSSGNASFDAYRSATLERLEHEQESFESFLGRLRAAKDKSEFDAFLDKRANRAIDIDDDALQEPNSFHRN